ncbi:MAG: hypothetical protein KAR22_09900 [Gammaproteobacteria bacterium]|nr:hypothetical protein [Gammaproteobacteria bacterium]
MSKAIGKVTMICVCMALPLMGALRDAGAQGGAVMTYPRSGQSQDQHDRDRMECSQSAIDSTGFDPLFEAQWLARSQGQLHSSVTSPAPDASGPGAVGGAAIGASLGAIAGGIGGNAGRGARIGATSGGLLGAGRRGNRRQEQAQWERKQAAQRQDESQQLQAQFDAGMANYERAFTVCMRARDYEAL